MFLTSIQFHSINETITELTNTRKINITKNNSKNRRMQKNDKEVLWELTKDKAGKMRLENATNH